MIRAWFSTVLLLALFCEPGFAQKKIAWVSGRILDENERPLAKVSIVILGRQSGIMSTDSGEFRIQVPVERAFALIFSFTGYKEEKRNFILNEGEEDKITIRMEVGNQSLKEVQVTSEKERKEAGLIKINPKDAINIPTPTGGIESLIKVVVGSNNELTSQYSVRGGNYDENLIYVNDFEIFRPYLVSNAQQEGLSFINPEMTRSVSFYNGGYQARYGDKMSSVMDIQYKKPKQFGGSAYIGLLEQGLELEGTGFKNKFSWIVGIRNRTNKSLVSSQETKGNYQPSSADLQSLLTYQLNDKNQLEFFGSISQTKFTLIPESSQLSSSVFSPYYTANLALDIDFSGQELDRYTTNMIGLSWIQQPRKNLRLKWMASRFEDNEQETYDITGNYLFGERDFDKSSSTYGLISNPLGAGVYQTYARDRLNITVWNASHKGSLELGKHFLQWGLTVENQTVNDKLHEWEYQDSAGYSLPHYADSIPLSSYLHSTADLQIGRITGFMQDNIVFSGASEFTMQAGLRYNYNNLNNQFLISPRIGISWKPKNAKKDIIYRAAAGIYDQPPFYRELRRPDGSLNEGLKAQQSWQVVAGFDYNFHTGDRPFRLTTEAYYKNMTHVVPYDLDNVRIRYYGENSAKAYAAGIEMRLFGELVKDAESWVSIGFMKTREKIANAYYYNYQLDSLNQPVDSVKVEQGWVRRPTDRLFTFGMFIQDYLATNKNFKVYLN
ncbi:MAG: carboxypeptidase-like regulatory domain-containing protein, partial [Chitinophagales bacterium]